MFKKNKANKAIKNNGLKKFSILSAVALLSSYLITTQFADSKLSNISSVSALSLVDLDYDEVDDTLSDFDDFGSSYDVDISFDNDDVFVEDVESGSSLLKEAAFKNFFGDISGAIKKNLRLGYLLKLARRSDVGDRFRFSDSSVSEDFARVIKDWKEYREVIGVAHRYGGYSNSDSRTSRGPVRAISEVYHVLSNLHDRLLHSLSSFATSAGLKTYKDKAVAEAASGALKSSDVDAIVEKIQWKNLLDNDSTRDKAGYLIVKAIECFNKNEVIEFCKFAKMKVDSTTESELGRLCSALKFILTINAAVSKTEFEIYNIALYSKLLKILTICESEATATKAYKKIDDAIKSLGAANTMETAKYDHIGRELYQRALQALGSGFMNLSYDGISQIFNLRGKNYLFSDSLSKFLLEYGLPLKNIFSLMSGSALISQPLKNGRRVGWPVDIVKGGKNEAELKQLQKELSVILNIIGENAVGNDHVSKAGLSGLQALLAATKSVTNNDSTNNIQPDFMMLCVEEILNFVGEQNAAQNLRTIQLEMQANAQQIDYLNTQLRLYSNKNSYFARNHKNSYAYYNHDDFSLIDGYLNSDYLTGYKSLYRNLNDDDSDNENSYTEKLKDDYKKHRSFDSIIALTFGPKLATERLKNLHTSANNIKATWNKNVLTKIYASAKSRYEIFSDSLTDAMSQIVGPQDEKNRGSEGKFYSNNYTGSLANCLLAMQYRVLPVNVPAKYVERRTLNDEVVGKIIPLEYSEERHKKDEAESGVEYRFNENFKTQQSNIVRKYLKNGTYVPFADADFEEELPLVDAKGDLVDNLENAQGIFEKEGYTKFSAVYPLDQQYFIKTAQYMQLLQSSGQLRYPSYGSSDDYGSKSYIVDLGKTYPFLFYNDYYYKKFAEAAAKDEPANKNDVKLVANEDFALNNYYEDKMPHFDMRKEIYCTLLDPELPIVSVNLDEKALGTTMTIDSFSINVQNHFIEKLKNTSKNKTDNDKEGSYFYTYYMQNLNNPGKIKKMTSESTINGFEAFINAPSSLLTKHLKDTLKSQLEHSVDSKYTGLFVSKLLKKSAIEKKINERLAEFKKILASTKENLEKINKAIEKEKIKEKDDAKNSSAAWNAELIPYGVFDGGDVALPTETANVESTDQSYTFTFDIPTNLQKDKFVLLIGTEKVEGSKIDRHAETVRVDGTTNPKSQIQEFSPQGEKLIVTVPKSYFGDGVNEIHLKHRSAAEAQLGKDYTFLKKYKYYRNDALTKNTEKEQTTNQNEKKPANFENVKKAKVENPEKAIKEKSSNILVKETSTGKIVRFEVQLDNDFNRNKKLMAAIYEDGSKIDPTHQHFDASRLVDSNNKLTISANLPKDATKVTVAVYEKEISPAPKGIYLGKLEAANEKDSKAKAKNDYGNLSLYDDKKEVETSNLDTTSREDEEKQEYTFKFTARKNILLRSDVELKFYGSADNKVLATTTAKIAKISSDGFYDNYGEAQYTIKFKLPEEIDEKTDFYVEFPARVAVRATRKLIGTKEAKMKSSTLNAKTLADADKINFDCIRNSRYFD